jgi:hypothetical protein
MPETFTAPREDKLLPLIAFGIGQIATPREEYLRRLAAFLASCCGETLVSQLTSASRALESLTLLSRIQVVWPHYSGFATAQAASAAVKMTLRCMSAVYDAMIVFEGGSRGKEEIFKRVQEELDMLLVRISWEYPSVPWFWHQPSLVFLRAEAVSRGFLIHAKESLGNVLPFSCVQEPNV